MGNKKNIVFIIKLAAILFAITFIATVLLTLCNYLTKDRIAALESKNAEEAKASVISGAVFDKLLLSDGIYNEYKSSCGEFEVFRARKNNEFAGYCINVKPTGYIGEINMIVGINPDLSFAGIKIISLSETPGLGAKAADEEFYGQFAKGKKGELKVVKNSKNPKENEINAVSGATISSKAITSGANCALKIAEELMKKEA